MASRCSLRTEVETFIASLLKARDVSDFFHKEGIQLVFPNENEVQVHTQPNLSPPNSNHTWRVESSWILSENTACVTVISADTALALVLLKTRQLTMQTDTPSSPTTFLRATHDFRIICMMTCPFQGPSADTSEVLAAAEKYMTSNRAASKEQMAKVFHPVSRLTYVSAKNGVAVHTQPNFLNMVAQRWSSEPYRRYAHLRTDPRVQASDQVISLLILGPRHAIVKLTVGFPPLLFTDILFFAKIGKEWFIVAKSSGNQPFLVEQVAHE